MLSLLMLYVSEKRNESRGQLNAVASNMRVSITVFARSTIAKGGSVSFEWPKYCEGWKQPQLY